ncbi:hypothetical protein HHK36_001059 [Tetracentron sinense]|uniref:Histone deacetylase complex subunit SAP18 n=1 Tax=Tetracentron sinense TaxID=13715 RepID=A0A835DQM9_TETSI|nr:hypothetical protein HHK36_001059 [Tetracentron sinense]
MAGVADAQNRPGRPLPPSQPRGPPSSARPRFEPVDLRGQNYENASFCAMLVAVGRRKKESFAYWYNLIDMVVQIKIGGHHTKEDFVVRGKEPKDEVQIYTWKDATLRELTDLVKEVAPAARRRDAKLSFAFVYPDKNGRYVVRQVGMTHSYGNGRRQDDSKALAELSFQIGDYLDVAIL